MHDALEVKAAMALRIRAALSGALQQAAGDATKAAELALAKLEGDDTFLELLTRVALREVLKEVLREAFTRAFSTVQR
jgi:hypothetical protein